MVEGAVFCVVDCVVTGFDDPGFDVPLTELVNAPAFEAVDALAVLEALSTLTVTRSESCLDPTALLEVSIEAATGEIDCWLIPVGILETLNGI